jgi:hypothetical protein
VGISDDIENTLAQLNELHAGERIRRAEMFAGLQAVVANRDTVVPPMQDDYEEIVPQLRRPDGPRRPSPAPGGFEEPPIQDGRPGHEFSGALRAKLVRDALDKGNW